MKHHALHVDRHNTAPLSNYTVDAITTDMVYGGNIKRSGTVTIT